MEFICRSLSLSRKPILRPMVAKCETVAFSVSRALQADPTLPPAFSAQSAMHPELSRKPILVPIQNAKLSHFPCPMDPIGYPLRSRLNLPCIPRRAFAKVDPRPNPKCETVSFSVSHGSYIYIYRVSLRSRLMRSRCIHESATRPELSRKSILVPIRSAKLSHFPCPMDPIYIGSLYVLGSIRHGSRDIYIYIYI